MVAAKDKAPPGPEQQSAPPVAGNVRLARYLASCGVGSRRKCEKLIEDGRVCVDNHPVQHPAVNVNTEVSEVSLDGKIVQPQTAQYFALNKPRGYTCSLKDDHAEHLISSLFPDKGSRLFPVGRLDRDSEGLLICTNDGRLANLLAHPRYEVIKQYQVETATPISEKALSRLRRGVRDKGEFLQPVRVTYESFGKRRILTVELNEGRKNEIRRLCRCNGIRVNRLIRTAFGPLTLSRLPAGENRELSPEEVELLYSCARKKNHESPINRGCE